MYSSAVRLSLEKPHGRRGTKVRTGANVRSEPWKFEENVAKRADFAVSGKKMGLTGKPKLDSHEIPASLLSFYGKDST